MFNVIGTVYDIDYDITEEDVQDEVGNPQDYSSEELYDFTVREKIKEVKESLPKEMKFYLSSEDFETAFVTLDHDDPASLDLDDDNVQDVLIDLVQEYITDETDMCLNGFVIDFNGSHSGEKPHTQLPTYGLALSQYSKHHGLITIDFLMTDDDCTYLLQKMNELKFDDLKDSFNPATEYIQLEVEEILQCGENSTYNVGTVSSRILNKGE